MRSSLAFLLLLALLALSLTFAFAQQETPAAQDQTSIQMPVTKGYITPALALGFGLVVAGSLVYRRRG